MKKILILIIGLVIFCTATPAKALEEQSTGETTVGYVASTSAEMPGGGNGQVSTGDDADFGKEMILFGLSGSLVLIILISKGTMKERDSIKL